MADQDGSSLRVFAGELPVATLTLRPEPPEFNLVYEPAWVANKRAYALSPFLPLDGSASSASIRRFLENLLPEGRALDVTSRHANIQKNNVFGLIRHLGQETTGALTFLPPGRTPQTMVHECRALTLAELQQRISERNEVPFAIWDGKVRMSVAGYQDKLLVQRVGDSCYLVGGAQPSTHILKPEPLSAAMPFMVANEHFCMRLVSRMSLRRYGLDHAATVTILRAPDPVLAVQRFDRRVVPDRFVECPGGVRLPAVERLHIIDGCQATDAPVADKYERNMGNGPDVAHIRDGVGFGHLFAIRPYLRQPAVGIRRLTLWAISTLLTGNSDAHAKNISFLVGRAGLDVAELYDLVSVMQYDAHQLEHSLAMAFGDSFQMDDIKSFALAAFCERSRVSRAFFARELAALCEIARVEAVAQSEDPVYTGEEVAMVKDIAALVVRRAGLLQAMARDIPRFKADLF
jgi:serine/threonine-protein kinase HipA